MVVPPHFVTEPKVNRVARPLSWNTMMSPLRTLIALQKDIVRTPDPQVSRIPRHRGFLRNKRPVEQKGVSCCPLCEPLKISPGVLLSVSEYLSVISATERPSHLPGAFQGSGGIPPSVSYWNRGRIRVVFPAERRSPVSWGLCRVSTPPGIPPGRGFRFIRDVPGWRSAKTRCCRQSSCGYGGERGARRRARMLIGHASSPMHRTQWKWSDSNGCNEGRQGLEHIQRNNGVQRPGTC